MTDLLLRAANLTIIRGDNKSFFSDGNDANAVVITAHRMTFKVEKSIGKEPNKAEVTIYNLAPRSRATVTQKPLIVRLDAGYGSSLSRVISGDLTFASSTRDASGVDWLTKLEVGDGARAFAGAEIAQTFRAGVNAKDVVGAIAGTMGLKMPSNAAGAKDLVSQFASGVTLDGPSPEALTSVLSKHGYGWSIQDNDLQILKPGEARGGDAIIVSQATGMIGTPDYGGPKKPGKAPILKVKMQLYPALTPGGLIKVDSEEVKGLFRIQKVAHTGDTRSGEWSSEVEAHPVA